MINLEPSMKNRESNLPEKMSRRSRTVIGISHEDAVELVSERVGAAQDDVYELLVRYLGWDPAAANAVIEEGLRRSLLADDDDV